MPLEGKPLRLGFRVSKAEARIITTAARKKGLRLSEFIREAVLQHIKKKPK
jgi:uncharacterized protein (DUF1778 family)